MGMLIQAMIDISIMFMNLVFELIGGTFNLLTSWNKQSKAHKVELAIEALSVSSNAVSERIKFIEDNLLRRIFPEPLSDADSRIISELINAVTDIEGFSKTLQEQISPINNDVLEAAVQTYTNTSLQGGVMRMVDATDNLISTSDNLIKASLPKIRLRHAKHKTTVISEIADRVERAVPIFTKVTITGKDFFQHAFGVSGKQVLKQEIIMGDNINISDIQGSNINLKASLTQVDQRINALIGQDVAEQVELKALIKQLFLLLSNAPQGQAEAAEVVVRRVETAVEEAGKAKPDKEVIAFSLDSLKKAATNLAAVIPDILPLASKIASHILNITK